MITKGQKINDRYEIIKSIGEGGMANVYLAQDTILDRKVAIKVLRGDLANDEKFIRRFKREALSASSLSHPNIVEMYDVGEDGGNYYIVMEYIEGKTLKQLLKKRGNLTVSEAVDIMLQLTDGISHAHDSYIIHRDLKPQNIMIQEDGQIKITDFGIAMALNSTQLTQTNSVMGSVHYLPPEQASGKGSTIKCDIYSMGILFYELLTGVLPFKGDNAVEIALKHMRDPIPSVRKQNSNIPQSVENIIIRATAKNPKNRYNDVKEMYNDLKVCLDSDVMNQERYVYKYPEHETDDGKEVIPSIKTKKDKNKEEINVRELTTEEDPDDFKEDVEGKSKLRYVIWGLFGVLALLVVILSVVFLPSFFGKEEEIVIPDVAKLTVVEAEEVLRNAGLTVAVETEKVVSSEIPAGYVVGTDPIEGRTVKASQVITIRESIGEKTYTIESFIGESTDRIDERLKEYELEIEIVPKSIEGLNHIDGIDDINSLDSKTIIGQEPGVGTVVKKGEKVTLYVPIVYDKFPNFADGTYTVNDVQDFCTAHGIELIIKESESATKEPGTILLQSRKAGTSIYPDIKSITITIAKAIDTGEEENPEKNPEQSEDGQDKTDSSENNNT